jgi:hypothetical protein
MVVVYMFAPLAGKLLQVGRVAMQAYRCGGSLLRTDGIDGYRACWAPNPGLGDVVGVSTPERARTR